MYITFPSLARFWSVGELSKILPCEQTLRGALAAGREKEQELELRVLEFEFHLKFPCTSPLSELSISANQREAETSANVNKLLKTRAKGNDVITNVFSTNQHFASTFSMHVLKFQRRICKLSFLFPPPERSGELARRLVRSFFQHALHVARIQFQTQA